MPFNIRATSSIGSPAIHNTEQPFSNFDFIERTFGSVGTAPIHRIFSQARTLNYKTLVVELIESVGFSKDDDDDLAAANVAVSDKKLIRLSFFKSSFNSIDEVKAQDNTCFLGYAVFKYIIPHVKWIVFESVITPGNHEHNYLHGLKEYIVNICDKQFIVKGNLYCQQNGLTNVCAHVALRTCISILDATGDCSYSKMNAILKDAGMPHRVGNKALSAEQILLILDKCQIEYTPIEYRKIASGKVRDMLPYQSYIYGSVESGYPAILGFWPPGSSEGHMIPIIGHTFNEDMWVPRAENSYFKISKTTKYIRSESWVSTYICHDDNFGSYYCLPRQYIEKRDAAMVIATRSPTAKYDQIAAEAVAVQCLYTLIPQIRLNADGNPWARRLINAVLEDKGWIVIRTLYLTAREYIEHIRSLRGWNGESMPGEIITALEAAISGDLWVSEISLPELFPANKRKLGEVALNPLATEDSLQARLLFARILDHIYCIGPDRGTKAVLDKYNTEIKTHTELYPRI